MEPRISIIPLGVDSLKRSLLFYRDGLGFPTTGDAEQGIVFFQTRGTCLALYPYEALAKDVNDDFHVDRASAGESQNRRSWLAGTVTGNRLLS